MEYHLERGGWLQEVFGCATIKSADLIGPNGDIRGYGRILDVSMSKTPDLVVRASAANQSKLALEYFEALAHMRWLCNES